MPNVMQSLQVMPTFVFGHAFGEEKSFMTRLSPGYIMNPHHAVMTRKITKGSRAPKPSKSGGPRVSLKRILSISASIRTWLTRTGRSKHFIALLMRTYGYGSTFNAIAASLVQIAEPAGRWVAVLILRSLTLRLAAPTKASRALPSLSFERSSCPWRRAAIGSRNLHTWSLSGHARASSGRANRNNGGILTG